MGNAQIFVGMNLVVSCFFAQFEVGSHGCPRLGHLCEATGTEGGGGGREGGGERRKKGEKRGWSEHEQDTAAGLVQGRGWRSEGVEDRQA